MASANSKYVIVWTLNKSTVVYGNRHGLPFESEANAQRSMTRRSKGVKGTWGITELCR